MDPAVNPIIKKKENSAKSLGKELTISFIWVIWPCAPQVYLFWKNLTQKNISRGNLLDFFLFSKEFRKFIIWFFFAINIVNNYFWWVLIIQSWKTVLDAILKKNLN